MCKESDVCESEHDWRDDIPEPDDLGEEIVYDLGYMNALVMGGYFCFTPAMLYLVDAESDQYFEENGILYETYPYPEGGYVYF